MTENKAKILVLAYHINPGWTSVPLEAWHEYKNLRTHFSVTLVTHSMNCANIKAQGIPDHEVYCFNLGIIDRFLRWFIADVLRADLGSQKNTMVMALSYPLFEWVAWLKLKHLIKKGEFALVHRSSPVAPIIGSSIAWFMRKLPTPFTVGPLNGGLPWPKNYENALKEKEGIAEYRGLAYYIPFVRSTYTRAKAVILGSSFAWFEARKHAPESKLFFIHENGIPESDIKVRKNISYDKIKICFIGRLVPYKNCNIVISAVADLVKNGDVELEVIGDGPEMPFLVSLAEKLGIKSHIKFHGFMPHAKAMETLGTCHILAFPSVREFGGGVVIEAMARGVVPIVVRYGGPADIVTDECGIRLPLAGEVNTIRELNKKILELVESPAKLVAMGDASYARARDFFTWEVKTSLIAEVLKWAITGHKKPDLTPDQSLRQIYGP